MAACNHTVLLCDDGTAVAFGRNNCGQCTLPRAPEGTRFVAAAVGEQYTLLLTDDGQVLGCGRFNSRGGDYTNGLTKATLSVPVPSIGARYVAMSAGPEYAVLLQDDGKAVAIGNTPRFVIPECEGKRYVKASASTSHTLLLCDDGSVVALGQSAACDIPDLSDGLSYVDAVAGDTLTVLLRTDGKAVILDRSNSYARFLPSLPQGVKYVSVGIGEKHVVLLRDDGVVVACRANGRLFVPRLPHGRRYVSLSCGSRHTVLLTDDGQAIAFGEGKDGQCNVPPVPSCGRAMPTYIDAIAGKSHTVLLRDDGEAVTFGSVGIVPVGLRRGKRYVAPSSGFTETIITLHLEQGAETMIEVECTTLSEEQIFISQPQSSTLAEIKSTLAVELAVPTWALKLLLSSGKVLRCIDDLKSVGALLDEGQ